MTFVTSFVGVGLILGKYLASASPAQKESTGALNRAAEQQNAQVQPDQLMTLDEIEKAKPFTEEADRIEFSGGVGEDGQAVGKYGALSGNATVQGSGTTEQQDRFAQQEFDWAGPEEKPEPKRCLLSVVADGHGTSADVAASITRLICNILPDALQGKERTPENFRRAVNKLVAGYQKDTETYSWAKGAGTTLTGSVMLPNGELFAFNVGDSKTLLAREQDPIPLTADQSFTDVEAQERFFPKTPEGVEGKTVGHADTTTRYVWHKGAYTYVVLDTPKNLQGRHAVEKRRYSRAHYEKNADNNVHWGIKTSADFNRELSITTNQDGSDPNIRGNGSQMYSEIGTAGVPAHAESTHFQAQSGDYVISASDGVWDVLTNREVNSLIQEMKEKKYTTDLMSATLVQAALIRRKASKRADNITVTVTQVPLLSSPQ